MKELEMSILRKAQDGEVEGCLRKAPFLDAIGKATPLGLATKMMGCKHQKRLWSWGQGWPIKSCGRANYIEVVVVVVEALSCVRLFVTPWTAARQASLSFTISQSLLNLMSLGSAMPSNHLILSHPPLLLPSIFPSIRVFSNDSVLCISLPKCCSFSYKIESFQWIFRSGFLYYFF